jgi:hypothetical protein
MRPWTHRPRDKTPKNYYVSLQITRFKFWLNLKKYHSVHQEKKINHENSAEVILDQISLADPDLIFGAFLTPGSEIRDGKNTDPG